MVKLDNPYSRYRPSWKTIIPVLFVYPFFKATLHFSIFSFIYNYAIALLLLIIISQIFDVKLLSFKRIFAFNFPFEKKLMYIFTFIILLIPLRNLSIYFNDGPRLLPFFQGKIPQYELAIVLICIIAPFEELFYRGFIQFNLQFFIGKIPAIIVASILNSSIGLIHNSIPVAIILFVISLFFGIIYSRTESIIQSSILHILFFVFMFIFPY